MTSLASLLLLFIPVRVDAQDCSLALIPSKTSASSEEVVQLSLAWSLSETAYQEAKKGGSGQAVIYGIPAGGSYSEFRKNIHEKNQELNLANFESRSFAYATSGLDDYARDAYTQCLASQGGLAVYAKGRFSRHYSIGVRFVPRPDQPTLVGDVIAASNINPDDERRLRTLVEKTKFGAADFEIAIQPENPRAEGAITVKVGAVSRHIVLPPLEVPPQEPKYVKVEPILVQAIHFIDGLNVAPSSGEALAHGPNILLNAPDYRPRKNAASWRIAAQKAGLYRFEVEYAAASARPVTVLVNGAPLRGQALTSATGCWDISCQGWHEVGMVSLKKGINIVRFESETVFPHIRTLKFTFE